jgi:autotransporter-associated beta strand protein
LSTGNFVSGASLGFDTSAGNRAYSGLSDPSAGVSLGLTKVGTNTLTLSGCAYTGNTTIRGGELITGAISGVGTTELLASTKLTANSIVQNTLIIGAGGSVTIREVAVGGAVNAGSAPVPEPGTWVLIGIGLLSLLAFRRRR